MNSRLDSLTRFPETHGNLHGEKVVFGLIAQLFLEGKTKEKIEPTVSFLHDLNLPYCCSHP
ncbi:hypothetical protein L9W92_15525 [Pelotomaculum terephthalicicum JT]|uniref:hypothetical protein n=1 Tax=Pelotomaculum terephthalicicum TaxID=206393 RepID=UPI001F03662A|nr:hypothetical protein [Pelotomaculum terephthalicicum]MCG9969424.1 hypothetical protein [Pelotomaculum terephthalicicum JT]